MHLRSMVASKSCRSIGQKFIDLTTIDISHEAPYHQRNRYENTITMQSNDPNSQSGPMKNREMIQGSYESADVTHHGENKDEQILLSRRRNGPGNATRLIQQIQEYLIWLSENWRTNSLSTTTSSSSSSSTRTQNRQNWWRRKKWHGNNWDDR